jgi:hypothetical protein
MSSSSLVEAAGDLLDQIESVMLFWFATLETLIRYCFSCRSITSSRPRSNMKRDET